MIIGIAIGTDGQRYIAYMEYCYRYSENRKSIQAMILKEEYDEVYIVDISKEINNKDLINFIVTKGCRI